MARLEKNLMRLFALFPCSLWALQFTVTTTQDNGNNTSPIPGSLRQGIMLTNEQVTTNLIDFDLAVPGPIVLMSPLQPIITNLEFSGPATLQTISGQNLYQTFTAFPGVTLSITGVLLSESVAQGGQGGGVATGGTGGSGGGGGAGLGGGLFVGAGSAVTISNLSFQSNQAIGGMGGVGSIAVIGGGGGGGGGLGTLATGGSSMGTTGISGGGGGGGLYGAGGNAGNGNQQGGGGGGGALGTGSTNNSTNVAGGGGGGYPNNGGPGAAPGTVGGGQGGTTGNGFNGATYGGGGGGAGGTSGTAIGGIGGTGGGGGGAGASGAGSISETGGVGGYGGGGGGAGPGTSSTGGLGGVGGGGGGAGTFNGFGQGGAGGFGGGGGGSTCGAPVGTLPGGAGGFGGGVGGDVFGSGVGAGAGGGGGGAAFGGAIFIDNTGTLTIQDGCSFSGNSCTVGRGGNPDGNANGGANGTMATGLDIFLRSGGNLIFDLTTTLALKNPIAGDGILTTGGLTMEGSGTLDLTMTGTNTYAGITTITSGTLIVAADSNLGESINQVSIANGTLSLENGFSSTRRMNLIGNAVIAVNSGTANWNGYITTPSGPFSLTKTGVGALILDNTSGSPNDYMGTTTVAAGTLSLQTSTSLGGSTAVAIQDGATLEIGVSITYAQPVTLTGNATVSVDFMQDPIWNGVFMGSGSLIKAGPGTLILGAANTYGGTTTINAGVLSIGASGQIIPANSDVTIDSAGVLDLSGFGQTISSLSGLGQVLLGPNLLTTGNSENTTYGGVISDGGAGGQLTKQGSGIFTLTGANTYVGLTSVMAGTLVVNGSITSGVTVAPGAILRGGGTITGNVTANGTVFPGSSIGTLTIVGNYIQGTGSTFVVELNPSTADLLAVSGTATIDPGATLVIMPDLGSYKGSVTYKIIGAGGGVTGTFSTVLATQPFLSLQVIYLPNEVDLIFSATPSEVVTKGNAGVVARAISCILATDPPPAGSDLATVFAELGTLTLSPLKKALNQLQPAFYKNFILAQQENTIHVREGFTNRLEALFEARCPHPKPRTYSKGAYGVWEGDQEEAEQHPARYSMIWGNAIGYASDQGGSGERSGYEANTGGFIAGFDYAASDHFVCGLGGAYTYTHVDIKESHGDGHINSYYGSLYGSLFGKHFFFDGVLMYGFDQFNESRKIHFGTIHRKAHTDHNGNQFTAHLDGGVIFQVGRAAQLLPFLSVDYLFLHEQGFTEHGAKSLDLKVDRSDDTLLRSEGGLRFTTCVVKERSKWIPELSVSAIRESRFNGRHYRAHFKGEPCAMVVRGLYPDRTLFSPAVSLTGLLCDDQLSLSLRYEGEFGQRYQNNLGSLRLGWLF
jgi:autotransporter-associated beta strand protein